MDKRIHQGNANKIGIKILTEDCLIMAKRLHQDNTNKIKKMIPTENYLIMAKSLHQDYPNKIGINNTDRRLPGHGIPFSKKKPYRT